MRFGFRFLGPPAMHQPWHHRHESSTGSRALSRPQPPREGSLLHLLHLPHLTLQSQAPAPCACCFHDSTHAPTEEDKAAAFGLRVLAGLVLPTTCSLSMPPESKRLRILLILALIILLALEQGSCASSVTGGPRLRPLAAV